MFFFITIFIIELKPVLTGKTYCIIGIYCAFDFAEDFKKIRRVGAFLVMSYPHFLFADTRYRDGVIGMRPDEETHKIFMDLEPNTGTPVRGAKRAQFNIFTRPISGISSTQNLRTTLMPILWVEESIILPQEFVDELTDRLLNSLRLVSIFIPIIIALTGVVLLAGVGLIIRAKCKK